MHVDGFRFDLAAALARELHDVDRLAAFFGLVQQDLVISQVKLIAEPWDVRKGGYQVGKFPPLWSEWNGKYRDYVRDLWRGEPTLPEFALRSLSCGCRRDFEFVAHRQNWGEDRVHLHDEDGELFSLPAGWTDVAPADPFAVIADGRCPFTIDGLLALVDLIGRLRSCPARK
jgi:hypothetical protein